MARLPSNLAVLNVVRQIDDFLRMTAPQARTKSADAEAAYTKIYQGVIALHDKGYITHSIFDDSKRIVDKPSGDSFLTFWDKQNANMNVPKGNYEYVFISPKAMPIPKRAETVSAGDYIHGVDSVFSQRLTTVKNLLKSCLSHEEKSIGVVAISHPAQWADISITINDADLITIRQGDTICGKYSYSDIGLTEKSGGKLSALFQQIVLQNCTKFGTTLKLVPTPNGLKEREAQQQLVARIRAALKSAFGIQTSPIVWDNETETYVPVFKCKVHRSMIESIHMRQFHFADDQIADTDEQDAV